MQVSTIENKGDEPLVIDSREVAEMMGKEHRNVIRDIRTIIGHLSNESNFGLVEYFIESRWLCAS